MSTQTKKPVTVKAGKRRSPRYVAGRLERLRDEVRLDLHLARMDAKDHLIQHRPRA